jgi:glycosyltransferase involved in cell wall biosynthesis
VMPPRDAETRTCTALYFSNLYPSKGAFDFVDAIRDARERGCDVIGTMVGSFYNDDVEHRMRERVAVPGSHVRLLPPVGTVEKFAHFVNADVFVFPPREPEGMPWVIVEALAAGLPIIATDQGAITDAVIDGYNGFIVEPGRPDRIAEKLHLLVADPDLRAECGRRSRAIYNERYTEEAMVASYRRMFDTVLGIPRDADRVVRSTFPGAPCAE